MLNFYKLHNNILIKNYTKDLQNEFLQTENLHKPCLLDLTSSNSSSDNNLSHDNDSLISYSNKNSIQTS